MVSKKVSCKPMYDETWWEAKLPAYWMFRQDKSIKGWPYLFISPSRARLLVHTYPVDISDQDLTAAPANLTAEQKKAYLDTACIASRTNTIEKGISKIELGDLVGFVFNPQNEEGISWEGFFTQGAWMLHVIYNTPRSVSRDSEEAQSVLASFRFQRPNKALQSDA